MVHKTTSLIYIHKYVGQKRSAWQVYEVLRIWVSDTKSLYFLIEFSCIFYLIYALYIDLAAKPAGAGGTEI